MQEIRHDGVEMDWEPLDHEKMRAAGFRRGAWIQRLKNGHGRAVQEEQFHRRQAKQEKAR